MHHLHTALLAFARQQLGTDLLVNVGRRPADVRDTAVAEPAKVVQEDGDRLDLGGDEPTDRVPGGPRGDEHAGHPESVQQWDARVVVVLVVEQEPVDAALPRPPPVDVQVLPAFSGEPEQQ